MKKVYQVPTIKLVAIKTSRMIAASSINVGTSYNGTTVLSREVEEDYWEE